MPLCQNHLAPSDAKAFERGYSKACGRRLADHHLPLMHEVKDTLRASVRISYDGRVYKTFRGPKADERFSNEVRVLRFLEARNCPFVPRLLENYPDQLRIV